MWPDCRDNCSGSIRLIPGQGKWCGDSSVAPRIHRKGANPQGQPDSPETRKTLREDLITEEVIAQEALKKGLDKDPDFVTQLEMARQTALVRAYQVDYIKNHPVSDEELRKEYEAVKAQMGDKEYKAHHILVAPKRKPRTSSLVSKKATSLRRLRRKNPSTPAARAKGGELDWSPAASYVQPFGEALTKLTKGQLTDSLCTPTLAIMSSGWMMCAP